MPSRPFPRSSTRGSPSWQFLTNHTHVLLAIRSERVGRRNGYGMIGDTTGRHPLEQHHTMGDMLDIER